MRPVIPEVGSHSRGDILLAQFARSSKTRSINLRTLTPFQRSLLVIDGTVTKFLEAYTMEPVEVERLGQVQTALREPNEWLDCPAGEPVVLREVMIYGRYSQTLFVYAVSILAEGRLPPEVRGKLQVQGEGIGRILAGQEMETRREILWYGRERLLHLPDAVRRLTDGEFFSRTYRIIAHGKPIAVINERFPLNAERFPSHH